MIGSHANPSDFTALDAGELLPGCSIPVSVQSGPGAGDSCHVFRVFKPLPIDGLSRAAKSHVLDSMVDVAIGLQRMHQAECVYGRLNSTSFHNRGAVNAPQATLWIDPQLAKETDSVHEGDPESMYWTRHRIESGAKPQPSDDWYALGIVLAEVAISSSSVHRIWELSRQDGQFADRLIKNLKRSRCDRRLKGIATALIQQGSKGHVDSATIAMLTSRPQTNNRTAVLVLLAIAPIVLGIVAWDLYQRSEERYIHNQQIALLETRSSELQQQLEALAAQRQVPSVVPVEVVRPSVETTEVSKSSRDRLNWAADIAGRSLEQAIQMSEGNASEGNAPAGWRAILQQINALPGQRQWRIIDPIVRRQIQVVVDRPWDASALEKAIYRIESLTEAHKIWMTWASGTKTMEEIRTQHGLMPAGVVKDSLGSWLAELLDVRSLSLVTKVIKVDDENDFLDHLVGYESNRGKDTISWTWESVSGKGETIKLSIDDYRAGDTVSYWIQQDSSLPYWDSTVIEHTFKNPMLLWQLSRGLKLEDSASGYAVLLTSDKKIGPPATIDAKKKAKNTPVSVSRKEVDPLDELPFDLSQ